MLYALVIQSSLSFYQPLNLCDDDVSAQCCVHWNVRSENMSFGESQINLFTKAGILVEECSVFD